MRPYIMGWQKFLLTLIYIISQIFTCNKMFPQIWGSLLAQKAKTIAMLSWGT